MNKHLKIWAAAGLMALFMGTAAAAPQVILPKAAITASAADTIKDYTVGDFIYTVNETKGTASLKSVIPSKKGSLTSATVPAKITYKAGKTANVTSIMDGAFSNEYELTTANLANASSLITIGKSAFHYCDKLTSVTIPANVTTIMDYAFNQCHALKSVTFKGNKIKTINRSTFCGCKSLTSVSIPTSVTEIANNAFESCEALTSITIPASVKKMGFSTFRNCKALIKVTFASTSAAITFDGGNFSDCTALKNVVCGSGTSFALPSGVTVIPDYMFQNCKALTTVNISANIKTIGDRAFGNCEKLTAINVNTSNTAYVSESGVLYTKDRKTLIQYPSAKTATSFKAHKNTKQIAEHAFENVSKLESVDFSATNGMTISRYNFGSSTPKISSLTIPTSENTSSNGTNVLKKYDCLFRETSLNTLNNSPLVKNIGNTAAAPAFHDTIATAMYDVFESYDNTLMMDQYLDAYAKFAVKDAYNKYGNSININANTNNLTKLEKAAAIFKWVNQKAKYDHDEFRYVYKDGRIVGVVSSSNPKNHCDASVFLHKVGDSFYSVCDGYARAYNLIMKAAGLECYMVSSGTYTWYYTDENGVKKSRSESHAFNCVKIGSHYYIADPTNNILGVLPTQFGSSFAGFSTVDKWRISTGKRHPAPTTSINLANELKYQFCDLNNDTLANKQDHALMQFYLVKRITLTAAQRKMADVNGDGSIDYRDAAAMRWYLENYKGCSKTYYRMGDINMDGQFTKADAEKLQKYLLTTGTLTEEQAALADMNNDGKLNATDLSLLKSLQLYKLGDVNRNGKVNKTDKQLILKHIAHSVTLADDVLWYADYNGDGSIDVADAVRLAVDYNISD